MIGIVLISHGGLAAGLCDAAEMITGEIDQLECISLQPMDDIDQLVDRIQEAVKKVDVGEGALLLVDLFGASPFNACGRLALAQQDRYELVTGMNLPMLVELVVQREGLTIKEASQIAFEAGKSGVSRLSDKI